MKKTVLLTIVVLFTVLSAIDAQTPALKKRHINQQKRIVQGVKSGELTRGETVRLSSVCY